MYNNYSNVPCLIQKCFSCVSVKQQIVHGEAYNASPHKYATHTYTHTCACRLAHSIIFGVSTILILFLSSDYCIVS